MARYFFDTSALVKHYHAEAGTGAVDRIVGTAGVELLIARLTLVETISGKEKGHAKLSSRHGCQYRLLMPVARTGPDRTYKGMPCAPMPPNGSRGDVTRWRRCRATLSHLFQRRGGEMSAL